MYSILMVSAVPVFIAGLSAITKKLFGGEVETQTADCLADIATTLTKGNLQMLVLDLHLFEGKDDFKWNDLKNFENLVRNNRSVKIVVMYNKMDNSVFKWMYLLGINGIIEKAASIVEIQSCMQKVFNNQLYIETALLMDFITIHYPRIKRQGNTEEDALINTTLTNREKIVAKLLLEGKSNRQICTLLQVQPSTVSTFKKHVFKKLQVNNLMELGNSQIAV